jgi:alkylation response protein AidB-like acyl-CoA dehydrogenase
LNPLSELLRAIVPLPEHGALSDAELELLATLDGPLGQSIEALAAPNDAAGRYPTESIGLLKQTGLLRASVPRALGGMGASHRFSLECQLRLARLDSAVAQIFKVHDELMREIFHYCPEAQGERLAKLVLEQSCIIGLAVAEAGKTADSPIQTTAEPTPDGGFQLHGTKIYTTGAAEADHIATWGYNAAAATPQAPVRGMQLLLVPQGTPGVTIHRDWNALGQRATDSGRITFERVACAPEWIASVPGKAPLVQSSLRYQAGFAAVLTGLGMGALGAAAAFAADRARPWGAAGVERAVDDPMLQRTAGELAADLAGAYAAVMRTAALLDAFDAGAIDRGSLALPISAAKSLAHRASLRACSEMHGLMGTRSVDNKYGYDRWWRNARTLSLHDPVEYKHLELGRHLFTGWEPEPGVYQ